MRSLQSIDRQGPSGEPTFTLGPFLFWQLSAGPATLVVEFRHWIGR